MKLFLAIIAFGFPALELAGIYQIWQQIGAWTLLWLAAAVVAGIAVLRQAQAEFLPRLMSAGFDGSTPFAALWHSGRQFLAGVLLIFPGAISDGLAVILLLWPAGPRPPKGPAQPPGYGPRAANESEASAQAHARQAGVKPPGGGRSHDVIEGEWRRED